MARNSVTLNISPECSAQIEVLAKAWGAPKSSVVHTIVLDKARELGLEKPPVSFAYQAPDGVFFPERFIAVVLFDALSLALSSRNARAFAKGVRHVLKDGAGPFCLPGSLLEVVRRGPGISFRDLDDGITRTVTPVVAAQVADEIDAAANRLDAMPAKHLVPIMAVAS